MSVSSEYMREKLKSWRPEWNEETIDKWQGSQLESIYRKEQQNIYDQIMSQYGLSDKPVDLRTV